jgi:hypothetical protein
MLPLGIKDCIAVAVENQFIMHEHKNRFMKQ